jgi:hypothetical protein
VADLADDGPHTKGLGQELDGVRDGMLLNFTFRHWGVACQGRREACIRSIAVHEFGHALAFSHEQNRPNVPGECQEPRQGSDGDLELTPYDARSVMNYCNQDNDGTLSEKDIFAVQRLYPPPAADVPVGGEGERRAPTPSVRRLRRAASGVPSVTRVFEGSGRFGCEGEQVMGFNYRLSMDDCRVQSRHRLSFSDPEDAALSKGEAELEYEVDLVRTLALSRLPGGCPDTAIFQVRPIKLLAKRVTGVEGGQPMRRDDVPLWGPDFGKEDEVLTIIASPAKVTELEAAIEAMGSRCRDPHAPTGTELKDEQIAEIAQRSIVYIRAEGEHRDTGEIQRRSATGFLIGRDGFVITAKHILRDNEGGDFYRLRRLTAVVGGGRSEHQQVPLQILEEDADHDLALLKLEEPSGSTLPVATCGEAPPPGARLIAYGFPHGKGFSATAGSFNNTAGPSGLWHVTMPFTSGMSGGPLFDGRGRVRAVVKSGGVKMGSEREAALRWVVPIQYAESWLRQSGTLMRCEPREP